MIEFKRIFRNLIQLVRRDRDSNPGIPKGINGFRDRPIRPLWHLSGFGAAKVGTIWLTAKK